MRAYALQARVQVQGEAFGYIHHFAAHDERGVLIDTTWEADGCADPLPHPTFPAMWKWTHCAPFYTTQQPAQATQAEVTDEQIKEAFLANGFTIKDGHSDLKPYVYVAARAILALRPATQPCGHPASLVIRSAESGEVLYCEACDDKSGRRDAEMREGELLEANQKLRDEILALRPVRVPMTHKQAIEMNDAAFDKYMTQDARAIELVRSVEAHHRIKPKEQA